LADPAPGDAGSRTGTADSAEGRGTPAESGGAADGAPDGPTAPAAGEAPSVTNGTAEPLDPPPLLLPEPPEAEPPLWFADPAALGRLALGGAGMLVLVVALLALPRVRRGALGPADDPNILEDSAAFRAAFEDWAPLVLARRGSPRAIKRFANRMRYLVADLEGAELAQRIGPLMALGALDEVGEIGPGMAAEGAPRGFEAFRAWADGEFRKLETDADWPEPKNSIFQDAITPDKIETYKNKIFSMNIEDWQNYWSLSQGVRFSNGA
jgi:hypothetical protein